MDDSQSPMLSVSGSNNESVPRVDRKTWIAVEGSGFPPGVAVTLGVSAGEPPPAPIQVDSDGAFAWGTSVVPELSTVVILSASATYTDPTNPEGPDLEVVGRGKVTKDADPHPP